VTKLRDFEALPTMPESMKVYVLPWLIHLIGDVHQPLHTVARFDRLRPNGDRGGNAIAMKSGNLHSYWDSRIGTSETDRFLNQLVATIQNRNPKPSRLEMSAQLWANEGFDLRTQVYGFTGDGTAKTPAMVSDSYSVQARETAYQRAALAGYRLAEFLNQRLKWELPFLVRPCWKTFVGMSLSDWIRQMLQRGKRSVLRLIQITNDVTVNSDHISEVRLLTGGLGNINYAMVTMSDGSKHIVTRWVFEFLLRTFDPEVIERLENTDEDRADDDSN
jgi:hypothetical protein